MNSIKLGEDFSLDIQNLLLNASLFKFVWISPGEYMMGVPLHQQELFYPDEGVYQFKTKISQGYWIGQYLVTQAHWLSFGGEEKPWFQTKEINYPAYGISWIEAMTFCKKLNSKFKTFLPDGYHFSLPTELHWEYACRAGEEPINKSTSKSDLLSDYMPPAGRSPRAVGTDKANAWEIYDMLGNVDEWCFNITENYPEEPIEDWIYTEGIGFDIDYLSDGSIVGSGKYRSVRGIENLTSLRLFLNYNAGYYEEESQRFSPLLLGFRICLRPVTKWDLNDPILKKYNINIIG